MSGVATGGVVGDMDRLARGLLAAVGIVFLAGLALGVAGMQLRHRQSAAADGRALRAARAEVVARDLAVGALQLRADAEHRGRVVAEARGDSARAALARAAGSYRTARGGVRVAAGIVTASPTTDTRAARDTLSTAPAVAAALLACDTLAQAADSARGAWALERATAAAARQADSATIAGLQLSRSARDTVIDALDTQASRPKRCAAGCKALVLLGTGAVLVKTVPRLARWAYRRWLP